ncbi:two component transcriptional regulator, LuxR family [Denitrovibrio acetiphilus DSM 12809]|uniref:Two component transcriptional regulator, LuxR family n=1 Tax=Denitrovibrio acetiphilus (strain DSM 12809 / NBRC 114555 / N2460) TaxID=522772 RepID=D4H7D4_DENA2|nr:response regulator transcription factor [Denitrovibrio acetiphilus]ADD67933.1 two component transcriptional regulator, LuxR family [Denitrovibrio acetiphilus DSM 12809]
MISVLVYSNNTLFREYLLSVVNDINGVGNVIGSDSVCALSDSIAVSYPDYIIIDLFSRVADEEILNLLKNKYDTSKVVVLTTKQNDMLTYFSYTYGVRHYVYLDADVDEIIAGLCEVLGGLSENNCKKRNGSLTSRECEILKLIASGKTSREIGEMLCISKNTVDTHRNKMLQKLNLANSASLVHYAFVSGLV